MPTPIQPDVNKQNTYNATSTTIPFEKELIYTDAEKQYHLSVLTLIRNARAERERSRIEFNDMGFSEQDDYNIKADLAYVPKAKNKDDIRLVSGLTREKTNTSVAVALSYDFDTEVMAFDKDDEMLAELSDTASDLIEKSNQMEHWRQNRGTTYRGQVSRGTYFTMEVQEFPTKNYKSQIPLNQFGKIDVNWTDKPRKGDVVFRTQEIDPKMVILGDLKAMSLDKQPFIVVGRLISESEARSLFGTWDRFDYVPTRKGQVGLGNDDFFTYYRNNFAVSDTLSEGEMELVFFMRSLPYSNELAIYLNGVALTPIKERGYDKKQSRYKVSGFPLTTISASGEYPLVDWQFERIPNFFYSKAQPAKTKFDQDVLDFWIRFITKKAIRSINPTLGNKSGQVISNGDLSPGNIISNIRKDDLFPVLPPEMIQGVTNGEVSFYEMMKKEVDEKTMSREFQGQTQNQHQTATQFTSNQKAQLLKLGALVDGIIRGEMRRADLRLRNSIIPYWLNKHDKQSSKQTLGEAVLDIYDTFTVSKEGRDGKQNSIINVGTFDSKAVDPFEIMGKEERENKITGKRNKYTYLNPDQIDFIRTIFYYNVVPRERDSDAMQRLLFDNDVTTAKNLFGPESTNDESLKVKFAKIRGDNYDTWFLDQQEQAPNIDGIMADALGGQGQGQGQGQVPQQGGLNAASATPPAQIALQQ